MVKEIIILTDYKNYFGSKQGSIPYRSGLELKLIKTLFSNHGIHVDFVKITDVFKVNNLKDKIFLYTSSEDHGYHYKSFIEDIIYYLDQCQATLIPDYDFLRANNNKVYMELFRKRKGHLWDDKLDSWVFGTFDEMNAHIDDFKLPIVIKTATGAMSRGVKLAYSKNDLKKKVKSISKSKYFFQDLKDKIRSWKHKGYVKESSYRSKFILQSYIPNLKNDWKILIFGEKYFVLTRHVRKNDFRASGSHENYLPGSKSLLPEGLLDFAKNVFRVMKVPNLSLDVVFDGTNFHLVEFQGVYFGTSTILMSDVYFTPYDGQWSQENNNQTIEEIYVDSIIHFLNDTN